MNNGLTEKEIEEIFGFPSSGPLFSEEGMDLLFARSDTKPQRKPLLPKRIYESCQEAANKPSFFGKTIIPRFDFNSIRMPLFDRKKLQDIKPSPPGAIRPKP